MAYISKIFLYAGLFCSFGCCLTGWMGFGVLLCFGSGDREEKFIKSENKSWKVCKRCVSHHVDCLPTSVCSCQLPVSSWWRRKLCCKGDCCTHSLVLWATNARDCSYAEVSSTKLHLCFVKWRHGVKVPVREVAPPFLATKIRRNWMGRKDYAGK